MAEPRTLIFDLDGTLIDSAPDLASAMNALLAEFGAPALSEAAVRAMVGDGTRLLVFRALTAAGIADADRPEALTRALARYLELYGERLTDRTVLYPGVTETLEELQRRGHRMGICTNKMIHPTHLILAAYRIEQFFGAVIGGDSLAKRKPDPEPLLATIADLGGEPARAAMIGDSANDMLCARAAGVTGILIPSDYGARAENADLTLKRFTDLPAAAATL